MILFSFIYCAQKHFSFINKARFRQATLSITNSYPHEGINKLQLTSFKILILLYKRVDRFTLCFRAGVVGKELISGTQMSTIIYACLRDQK